MMNIFITDAINPRTSAMNLDTARLKEQAIFLRFILSSVLRNNSIHAYAIELAQCKYPFAHTDIDVRTYFLEDKYIDHPCTVWANKTVINTMFLLDFYLWCVGTIKSRSNYGSFLLGNNFNMLLRNISQVYATMIPKGLNDFYGLDVIYGNAGAIYASANINPVVGEDITECYKKHLTKCWKADMLTLANYQLEVDAYALSDKTGSRPRRTIPPLRWGTGVDGFNPPAFAKQELIEYKKELNDARDTRIREKAA